ncbi:hypothetical protein AZH90_004319 [Salmonella enterica subsp. enterica serovar Legon]|nr:hypothetical protein [Salmonella enterica subsp. enterica serovar Legon]EDW9825384.1 hypothetical protein [Salmonella enterica]EDZ3589435.1 hypothetical protein [Salmonella enterica subsp. enterica serovar Wagenia]
MKLLSGFASSKIDYNDATYPVTAEVGSPASKKGSAAGQQFMAKKRIVWPEGSAR